MTKRRWFTDAFVDAEGPGYHAVRDVFVRTPVAHAEEDPGPTRIRDRIDGSELHVIEDLRHFSNMEGPGAGGRE